MVEFIIKHCMRVGIYHCFKIPYNNTCLDTKNKVQMGIIIIEQHFKWLTFIEFSYLYSLIISHDMKPKDVNHTM